MKKWEDFNYQKIISAEVNEDFFTVSFANGDTVKINVGSLLPEEFDYHDLSNLRFTDYEITIGTDSEEITIPWDSIRVISDPEFAKEMAKKSEEHSKLIGLRLKALREKKNMKSSDLADRAGVTPQTISRIEKGHTDVSFSTLKKILVAMGYSLKDLANKELDEIEVKPNLSFSFIIQKLKKAGLESTLINKIFPDQIRANLIDQKNKLPDLIVNEISIYLNRVFGWTNSEIWGDKDLPVNEEAFRLAYYKKPTRTNIAQIRAYSHYAYYLATVVNNCNTNKPSVEYPGDIEEFKLDFFKKFDNLELGKLINHVWDMGICVIPLNDQGIFHGASWNINNKHVIVLKQRSDSHARWIFDLLHELYHVFAHLDVPNTSVVETEEPNPFTSNDSPEELEANAFANEFIFGKTSEDLALKSLEKAAYRLDYLKRAVKEVAETEKIRVDFLANYLAFRLQINGQNWWGTASNFQITNPSPHKITADILRTRINIENLNPIDKNLLTGALNY